MGFWKKTAALGTVVGLGAGGYWVKEHAFSPEASTLLPTEMANSDIVETTGSLLCYQNIALDDCNADNAAASLVMQGNNIRLDFADLDPFYLEALTATEDREFWGDTDGKVSNDKLAVCFAKNRGCSTIEWQLVRNLYADLMPAEDEMVDLPITNNEMIDAIATDVLGGAASLVLGKDGVQIQKRKVIERDWGFQLAQRFSKEEIVTSYANVVNTGAGAIGVEMGAWMHFGIPFSQTNHLQMAFLAGVQQSPNNFDGDYDPIANEAQRQRGIDRAYEVLDNMVEFARQVPPEGMSGADAAAAKRAEIDQYIQNESFNFVPYQRPQMNFRIEYKNATATGVGDIGARHYFDDVMTELRTIDALKNEDGVVTDQQLAAGHKIQLSLNSNAQAAIHNAVNANPLPQDGRQFAVQMLAEDGAVIGHYGGDYSVTQFDMADQAEGPSGSEFFKPFLYAKAFNDGVITLDTPLSSDPNFVWENWVNPDGSIGWRPSDPGNRCARNNIDPCYPLSAIEFSDNIAPLQIAEDQGISGLEELEKLVRDYGVTSESTLTPAGVLGNYATNPSERAVAMNSLVNNQGVRIGNYLIDTIFSTTTGQTLYQHNPSRQDSLVSVQAVSNLIDGMRLVPRSGTASMHLSEFPSDIVAKTGTDGSPGTNEVASIMSIACLDKVGGDVTMIVTLRHVDTLADLGRGQTGGNLPGKLTNDIGEQLVSERCEVNGN